MEFRYKGYDENGKRVAGRVEGESAADAVRTLRTQGVFVRSVAPAASLVRPLTKVSRAALWRELGALLEAGLPADSALALLRRRENGAEAAALARIEDGIAKGRGFAAAIDDANVGASAFESAALASAETGAAIPQTLRRLADGLEKDEETRAAVKAALAYPSFVLALGVAVAFAMAFFVVPEMTAKLAQSGVALPPSSLVVVSCCRFCAFVAAPFAVLLAVGFAAAKAHARSNQGFAIKFDRFIGRMPFAKYRRSVATARFSSVLGVLSGGGAPLADSVALAAAATDRPLVVDAAVKAEEKIRAGISPAEAIAEIPEIGGSLAPWIGVGEAGGCLPAMLEAAARRFSAAASRSLATRLSLLGPALLVAVGVFVLALSLALLLPVLDLSTAAESAF